MSSGFKHLFRRLRHLIAGRSWRVDRLAERGGTVFLKEVETTPPPKVVAIDFGYGTEFWAVKSTPVEIDPETESIRGGRLILESPRRAATKSAILEREIEFQRVHIRY